MKFNRIIALMLPAAILTFGFSGNRGIRDMVEWNESQKISWEDYKGKITDTSKITSSCCGIYCIPQVIGDSGIITIVAYFDRNKSWVSRKHSDSLLLIHEQGHFDLTEVYARKLRKKISSIRPAEENFSAEIKKFYSWAWDDLQKQHAAYDKATDHGAIDFAQRTWDKYIDEHLNLYKNFSSSEVRIRVVN